MSKSTSLRRDGRRAFFPDGNPEEECPYDGSKPWFRECWIRGWKEEEDFYFECLEAQKAAQEET